MPQLVALALFGAGLWAGYRWLRKISARVAEDLKRAEDGLAKRSELSDKTVPTLERDPETGIYRPAGREEP